ncbi:septal ring lytic transglycosylase RlpA family protein [Halomonas sp. WWR20]
MRGWVLILVLALLAGCASNGGGSGGRYKMSRDAYPDAPPDVSQVPDAVPRVEPLARSGNRSTYQVWGKTYHVLPDARGYRDDGLASWYGEKFQGYATASGETYDMYKMTAAHRSLPLPTYARVTNTDNGRSVIVKVNDRGPFHSDRLIDLSYAAAARLGILRGGTGHVFVEAIDPVQWQAQHRPREAKAEPVAAESLSREALAPSQEADDSPQRVSSGKAASGVSAAGRYLQVAAFGSASSARALQARLQAELSRPVRIASSESMYRVQVGPVQDVSTLEALKATLREAGYDQPFVVSVTE